MSTSATELFAAFADWATEHAILPWVQSNMHVVATWVDLCAPVGASLANRLVVCQDLGIVFFALDDYAGADTVAFLMQCQRILEGDEAPSGHAFFQAYAATLRTIAACSDEPANYIRGRRELIDHYIWREQIKQQSCRSSVPSFVEYLDRRRTTIYTRQWVDLWQILEGCNLTARERQSRVLQDALQTLVEWQIFENERVSVARDLAQGELNLVCLLRDEQGIELAQAAEQISQRRFALGARFEESLKEMAATSQASANWQRYRQILEQCYRGAIAINALDLGRYTVESQHP